MGVKAKKVYIPPTVMDDVYAGRIDTAQVRAGVPAMSKSGDSAAAVMAKHDPRAVGVRGLIQRLGPNIHNWNASTIFSIDRLFDDVGFRPAYSFAAAVEQTCEWFQRERYSETLQFDFGWEDEMLARLSER